MVRKVARWFCVILFGLLLRGPLPAAGSPLQMEDAWELVGTHPEAAKQPTASGKTLRHLFPWKGRLYSGFGDYGANTGPIAISPFDPADMTFHNVWTSDTEAIENYRLIRGRLYAPATDPKRSADYAVGEPWQDLVPVGMTHSYDMVTLDGTDLWLVGSKGNSAVAFRSLDDGAHWTKMLDVKEEHGLKDNFARFYFAGVYADRLYLQATDFSGGAHRRSHVFDGSEWSAGPDLLAARGMGWRPETFAGKMVYRSFELGGGLMAFDGRVARYAVGWNALDVVIEGGVLYALATHLDSATRAVSDPEVLRTPDLVTWEVMSPAAPVGCRSLAWLSGSAYVGATDARLFRLAGTGTWRPRSVTWNAPPTARFISPTDGASFTAPARIRLAVDVQDGDDEPVKAVFWNGSEKLGETETPPHEIIWGGVPEGSYRVGVRASDAAGAYVDDWVTFTVTAADPGRQPDLVLPWVGRPRRD